jgi:hypothetical protein
MAKQKIQKSIKNDKCPTRRCFFNTQLIPIWFQKQLHNTNTTLPKEGLIDSIDYLIENNSEGCIEYNSF